MPGLNKIWHAVLAQTIRLMAIPLDILIEEGGVRITEEQYWDALNKAAWRATNLSTDPGFQYPEAVHGVIEETLKSSARF